MSPDYTWDEGVPAAVAKPTDVSPAQFAHALGPGLMADLQKQDEGLRALRFTSMLEALHMVRRVHGWNAEAKRLDAAGDAAAAKSARNIARSYASTLASREALMRAQVPWWTAPQDMPGDVSIQD